MRRILFRCSSCTEPGTRAWCWDENFLSFFADKGYRAVALSFRGHGNSPTDKPLRTCSVADYLDDVRSVADALPTPPVVIGHSMGGLIVQKYLESHEAPAGVLMTSMPPQGNLGNGLRWIRHRPWHFAKMTITGKALPYINPPELARERFFSRAYAGGRRPQITRHGCKKTARGSASTVLSSACPGRNG